MVTLLDKQRNNFLCQNSRQSTIFYLTYVTDYIKTFFLKAKKFLDFAPDRPSFRNIMQMYRLRQPWGKILTNF